MDDCELIVVRHGQTVANAAQILQGQANSDLDELGRLQAKALAERLKDEKFDLCFSSDLTRAVDTARAILSLHPGLPLTPEPRLREWNLGELEGKPIPELRVKYKEIMDSFTRGGMEFSPPGGESRLAFYERVSACLDDIVSRYPGKRILLVSHGGAIQMMLHKVLGPAAAGNLEPLSGNASLSVFRRRAAGWQMITWNENFYLRSVGQKELFTY